jgi:hypothetical protein
MNAARKMAFTGDYDVTMADWVEGLRVSERFKTQILLPWLTASEGHPLEDTKRSSARAILQLFAPSHPKNSLTKPTIGSSRGGFQATITTLAEQCNNTAIHVRTPILRIEEVEKEWFVYRGTRGGARSTRWWSTLRRGRARSSWRVPWAEGLVAVLDGYEHSSHKLAIHADPAYVHRDRRNWVLANVGVEDGQRRARASLAGRA